MSESNGNSSITIGPGFLGLLTIVFVVLKAFGKLDWSWLWVFSPLWIPVAFCAIVALLVAIVWLVALVISQLWGGQGQDS